MAGDTRLTYWGAKPDENWSNETQQMMGCCARRPDVAINEMMENMRGGMSARMVMQNLIAAPEKGGDDGRPKVGKRKGR